MTPSLDDRIARAFTTGTKADAVALLVTEAEAATVCAGEAAQKARQRALDPKLCAPDVAIARHEMEDAAFRRDRMQAAVTRLKERLNELMAQEEDQLRWVAYERVKTERDKLAAELREIYPPFASRIVDLMARIEANDFEIKSINTRAKPNRAANLLGAEAVARGLQGYIDGTANIPRVSSQLQLPAFEYKRGAPYSWPR
jgi:hypothetical protein